MGRIWTQATLRSPLRLQEPTRYAGGGGTKEKSRSGFENIKERIPPLAPQQIPWRLEIETTKIQ